MMKCFTRRSQQRSGVEGASEALAADGVLLFADSAQNGSPETKRQSLQTRAQQAHEPGLNGDAPKATAQRPVANPAARAPAAPVVRNTAVSATPAARDASGFDPYDFDPYALDHDSMPDDPVAGNSILGQPRSSPLTMHPIKLLAAKVCMGLVAQLHVPLLHLVWRT